ncbi:hypothetical protein [Phenylobacterium sp.]|jgi:hypothetical protein|uniref:hypothetical protein n=1 Tax=Phenylobacterium sp. TaxID=1871053 RepID=UPI002F3EA814
MKDELKATLQAHIHAGWQSNPAMLQIIDGYARYHAVLAITGAAFLIIFLGLAFRSFSAFRKIPGPRGFSWPFEKAVPFLFGLLFTATALLLALVITANVTNASNPLPGFSGSIPSIAVSQRTAGLHRAFDDWILSENAETPEVVRQSLHHRRVFHATRLSIGLLFLFSLAPLSAYLWKSLLIKRSVRTHGWTLPELTQLALGLASVPCIYFMILVVMANTQSAIVPLANTLQFG